MATKRDRLIEELSESAEQLGRALAAARCRMCGGPKNTPILGAWPGFMPDRFCPACGREAFVIRYSFCPMNEEEAREYAATYWQRQG